MTQPLNIQWHDSEDAAAQAQALAAAVAAQLRQAIAQRGQALLAVSGGRSPIAFFQALRTQDLPWPDVTLMLVDERCVPPTHADSNARLVREHLLQDMAARAQFVPCFEALPEGWSEPPSDTALEALATDGNSRLQALAWPLDVLVLGMGEDGHVASLFSDAQGLAGALSEKQRVAALRPRAAAHARLSLGLPVLQQARHAHLAATGAAKRQVLLQAMNDEALPVSWVMHRPGTPLQVWHAP